MSRRSYIPTRHASKKQETKVAKELGGKITSNSGATDFAKGDILLDDMLIECKTTMTPKSQITLKKEWFIKNEQERFAMRKAYSAVVFDFENGKEQYIAMTLKDFKRIYDTK